MEETGKATFRRLYDQRFGMRYFVGGGIDIGSGDDSLAKYVRLFQRITSIKSWDLQDGDAQYMMDLEKESFDFVHSSHCLEHMQDPFVALNNWFRILKVGGHLIVTVPDEDLYEQGVFPSLYNNDHKWTFTLWKEKSWCDKSINVFDLIKGLGGGALPLKVERLDAGYRALGKRFDQTKTPIGESGIEFIICKIA